MIKTLWAPSPYTIHVAADTETVRRLETEARQAGASVIYLSLAGMHNLDDLDQRLAQTFMYPFKARGLDAAISLISDLEWFGNSDGYLVVVDTADASAAITTDVASIFPNILDRRRSGDEPFVVALYGDADWDAALDAIERSNRELDEAGREPGFRNDIYAVPIIDHRRNENHDDR